MLFSWPTGAVSAEIEAREPQSVSVKNVEKTDFESRTDQWFEPQYACISVYPVFCEWLPWSESEMRLFSCLEFEIRQIHRAENRCKSQPKSLALLFSSALQPKTASPNSAFGNGFRQTLNGRPTLLCCAFFPLIRELVTTPSLMQVPAWSLLFAGRYTMGHA